MNTGKSLQYIVVLALTVSALACGLLPRPSPSERLVGEWEGEYEGETVTLEFTRDHEFTVRSMGESLSGTYSVDFSFEPAHLDLVLDYDGGSEEVETIIEFLDEDRLHFENNYPGNERPTRFSDDVIFKRQ